MALASGTRLGPYEVVSPAGAGGMGEVYRACDTRLDRTVAIKVLPQQYSNDPGLRQRFEREARAISGLSHPHICHLYDVGHQDGTDYLVMEYLEGETLADRLKKGPLRLEPMLDIAIQIAGALHLAHRQGIVHRDLKPGNVMLTHSGAKLLDFGLAKPVGMATAAGSASAPLLSAAATVSSPSPHSPLTGQGAIIGTIQYMSPEQIEGKEADARSDIFAFGAMLYEMATGQRAFTGKSQISVASAILEKEPDPISRALPATPPALERIVRTCLAKSPDQRFQCAADISLELEWLREMPAGLAAPTAPAGWRSRAGWAVAAALLFLLAALVVYPALKPKPPQYSVHSYILAPEKSAFVLTENHSGPPVISPDGTRLAFTARNSSGQLMLWVQPLNSPTAQPLSGTEEAYYPFWSPDSRYIAFFGPNKLFRIEAGGGPPQALCDSNNGRGGAWNSDNIILFSPNAGSGLMRVNATGGTATPVTTVNDKIEDSHRWPQFLPDGKHYIYFSHGNTPSDSGVFVGSLDSKEQKRLLPADSGAVYADPGYLLFVRDNTLMAQAFSAGKLELSGDARPIAAHVAVNTDTWIPIVTVSRTGVLLYEHGSASGGSQLVWFGRDGKGGDLVVPEIVPYHNPALSPDGKKLAVAIEASGLADIWVIDVERKTRTRITFNAQQYSDKPVWSPDGRTLYLSCGPPGRLHLCRKAADGTGTLETVLADRDRQEVPQSVSPDGRYLAYMRADAQTKTGWDIWALPLTGERKPFPVVATEFLDAAPAISPNGRWVAYNNNESGKMEVYLQPFPSGAGKWQVSTAGGSLPAWRRDGKELYFRAPDATLMAVEVSGTDTPELGVPRPLFRVATVAPQLGTFTVTPDGSRFIVNALSAQQTTEPLTLVTNWSADLAK